MIDNLPLFSAMNREEVKPPFPHPHRPLTSQEAHFAIMEKVNTCIAEVNHFEQRVRHEIDSFMDKTNIENTGFKEAIQASYNAFMETVQREINNFETDMQNNFDLYRNDIDKRVADFQTAINNEFVTLQKNVLKASNDKIQEMEELKISLNKTFTEYKATLLEIVENFKTQVNQHMTEQDGKIEEYKQYMVDNIASNTKKIFEQKAENGEITSLMTEVYGATRTFKGSLSFDEIQAVSNASNGDYYYCTTDGHYYQRTTTAWVDIGNGERLADDYEAFKTSMGVEVYDIREGAEGERYVSAGEAVRSQTKDIPPTRLLLTGSATKAVLKYEDGFYYSAREQGNAPVKIENSDIVCVTLENVTAGDIIEMRNFTYNISLIDPVNFFIFVGKTGNCVVDTGSIMNYVVQDGETFIVTIPFGCVKFITATGTDLKNTASIILKSVKYGIDWLKLAPENFSDGCVPISALGKNSVSEKYVELTFTDGIYYKLNLDGDGTIIEPTEMEVLSVFTVENVVEGEKYIIFPNTSFDGEGMLATLPQYAIFETADGVNAVNLSNFSNYAELIDGEIHVTIPPNCIKLHSACLTSKKDLVYVKKIVDEFIIPNIKLTEENFTPQSIPFSALKNVPDLSGVIRHLDSLNKPFNFEGKKLLVFGDSITVGVTSPNLERTENSYINLFANKFNMVMTNRAVSGSTLAFGSDRSCITSAITSETSGDYDFIFVAGGTNDYNMGRAVGEYGDADYNTTYGAMKVICEHFKNTFPNATVIFLTPVNVTKDFPNAVNSLDVYRIAIYEVATSYGYNVVDGSTLGLPDSPSNWGNEMIGETDGCHPTEKGHAFYFRNLCNKLC